MKQVWGHLSEVNSRTVDTHIAELRKKLESESQKPKHIITIPKSGYKLVY
jgi:DNA-binding response OmpR family regulator